MAQRRPLAEAEDVMLPCKEPRTTSRPSGPGSYVMESPGGSFEGVEVIRLPNGRLALEDGTPTADLRGYRWEKLP